MESFLTAIDRRLSLRRLLWLVPIVLAIHNAEEALTMPRWVMDNLPLIRDALPLKVDLAFTPAQLVASVSVATVVPFGVALFSAGGRGGSVRIFPLLLIQAVVFLNAIIPHLYLSLWFLRYNPGIVTAVVLNIPFSLYFFRRLLAEKLLTRRGLLWSFVAAAVSYPAIAWLLHASGELIARLTS
ncbi:MAG TPA: HXXEE domain-containing protein [Bacteroidota bacterium]|nr:HXXEE domain-containing protein [Bacteroidota bacterium]